MIKSKSEVTKEMNKRGIRYLVHFTRLSNLQSILENGILPNDEQRNHSINSNHNDFQRKDNTDAICLSVSFPNYKLFYRFRESYSKEQWVVLLLDPSIIEDNICLFAYTNAASSEITSRTVQSLGTAKAFADMFNEPTDWRTRAKMQTALNETTDPQAEILVLNAIDPRYIKGIVLQSKISKDRIERSVPFRFRQMLYSEYENLYFSSARGKFVTYFDSRPDFRYWRY